MQVTILQLTKQTQTTHQRIVQIQALTAQEVTAQMMIKMLIAQGVIAQTQARTVQEATAQMKIQIPIAQGAIVQTQGTIVQTQGAIQTTIITPIQTPIQIQTQTIILAASAAMNSRLRTS